MLRFGEKHLVVTRTIYFKPLKCSSLFSKVVIFLSFIFLQLNLYGKDYSYIKNFPPSIYKASPAVYNITKDHLGILYFGTNNGITTFDGARWETISISNFAEVRCLEYSPDSIIYVGGYGNFGYLQNDPEIGIYYVSISDSLPEDLRKFDDIWQIAFLNNKVYFQSYAGIFIWDKENISINQVKDSYIFVVDDKMYASSYMTGQFGYLENDTIINAPNFPEIKDDLIFQVFDYDDSTLFLSTSESGMYLYRPRLNQVIELQTEISKEITNKGFYDGIRLDNQYYALGTYRGGIYFVNKSGEIDNVLNNENGLYANHVYDMILDNKSNLWLATAYGISRIILDSLDINLNKKPSTTSGPVIRDINFATDNQNVRLHIDDEIKDRKNKLFQINNEGLDINVLPSSIVFYYADPQFIGDDISYSVLLQGYDRQWSQWKSDAIKEYTNLLGGHYTFHVKAKNILTGETSEITSYHLSINTPWHQSTWIKVLIIILVLVIGYTIVRLMIVRLKTQNTNLEKMVDERTKDLVKKQNELSILNKSLVSANQELDSFVYHTSHDLKAPLKSILGLVNLAKYEDPDKKFSDYHDRIENSIHRLEGFISSIIQYSTNSNSKIKFSSIDFNKLIQNAINELQFHDDFNKINIYRRVNILNAFASDAQRIQIVLNNLLSNSIKYSDPNKSERKVEIDISEYQHGVKIIFEDNGVGISEEYQEKVFTMFYRASDKSYGSGLGLYIINETVNKLGGSVQMVSVEGHFTRFIIQLPNQNTKILA